MPEEPPPPPPPVRRSRHGWIVTVDHVGGDSRVDWVGPSTIDPDLADRLRGGEGALWRTLDGDGGPVHEGRYLELPGARSDAEMSPLDELSGPDAGATAIEVRPNRTRTWKPL